MKKGVGCTYLLSGSHLKRLAVKKIGTQGRSLGGRQFCSTCWYRIQDIIPSEDAMFFEKKFGAKIKAF